ncbi:MAG TPA: hypothetical protein VGN57_04700 [Pirellulaceae bacterium]|jgi:hypothetical protein|nr:hypothetical protein [Pirellulaceae bacterium]
MQRRRETAIPAAHSLRTVDLAFHLFERSIHPELFALRQGVVLERGALQARLYLTSTGHVCSFAWGKSTLTETICSTTQNLPRKRQRIERKLKEGSFEERALIGGAAYSFSLSVRSCGPAEFVELQQDALDAPPPQLIDAGERPDRWNGLRSLSWIRYELSAKALEVRSFRTLPSDYAVVETTSRFTLPGA